jgi:hypothetical protein
MADINPGRLQAPIIAKTPRFRILGSLIEARGQWVPHPQILDLGIAQYGARILELRRLGYVIENRTEHGHGERHSWFRLISSPGPVQPPSSTESDFMRRWRQELVAATPLFAEVPE